MIQQNLPYDLDKCGDIDINIPMMNPNFMKKTKTILSKYNIRIVKLRQPSYTYIFTTDENFTDDDIRNFKNAIIIHDTSKKNIVGITDQINGYLPYDEVMCKYKENNNTQVSDDVDFPSALAMKQNTDKVILLCKKNIIDGIKTASKNGDYEYIYEGLIPDPFMDLLKRKGYLVTKNESLQVTISWK